MTTLAEGSIVRTIRQLDSAINGVPAMDVSTVVLDAVGWHDAWVAMWLLIMLLIPVLHPPCSHQWGQGEERGPGGGQHGALRQAGAGLSSPSPCCLSGL